VEHDSDTFSNVGTVARAGNSVTVHSNTRSALGGIGQYATGTFTANGTNQNIDFDISPSTILHGFELRDTSVPEPSSLALSALGALALAAWRRRSAVRAR
jgi:hypothetical protein